MVLPAKMTSVPLNSSNCLGGGSGIESKEHGYQTMCIESKEHGCQTMGIESKEHSYQTDGMQNGKGRPHRHGM